MTDAAVSRLPENLLLFCRSLRAAGVPVGTAQVIDALRAGAAVGLERRSDWRTALRCSLVSNPAHFRAFDRAFDLYFRDPQILERLLASTRSLADSATDDDSATDSTVRSQRRLADNLAESEDGAPDIQDAEAGGVGYSARESLRERDFDAMTADELREAAALLRAEVLPMPGLPSRRFEPSVAAGRPDLRRSMRQMIRRDGELLELLRLRPKRRPLEIVLLCDVSGSMSSYSRVFLHLAHILTSQSRPVHSFVFGTRLTNITRHLRHPDADVALGRVSRLVQDWDGGTRIASSLRDFNRTWGRRLLARGAAVVLLTDGLERDTSEDLGFQIARLRASCRHLLWLNPMLRYAEFQPLAWGVRTMLPHVDAFLPVHNVNRLSDVVELLGKVSSGRLAANQELAGAVAGASSLPGRNTRTIMSASASTFSS